MSNELPLPLIKDCKYYDAKRCLATRELDYCSKSDCPRKDELKQKQTESLVKGVSPDAPVTENAAGGKQSETPYAFHMLPTSAVFAAAETCAYGAQKYGETVDDRNYIKISAEDHLNHALQHIFAHLAGDTQDAHLPHAIVRLMFAYDVIQRGEKR